MGTQKGVEGGGWRGGQEIDYKMDKDGNSPDHKTARQRQEIG